MKKYMMLLLAMCLIASLSAYAKDITVSGIVTDPMCAKSGDKAKMENEDCAKRCAKDGKLALVADSDGKVWAIENGDAVKGHEGHHVKVTGTANAEKMTFHVTTVAADMGAAAGHHDHDKMKKDDMKHDEMKKEEKKEDKKPEAKKTTEAKKS